jgi:ketosteroid isomerase-like protein
MSAKLPAPITAYVQATNDHDIDAFLASFSEDALVNDVQREFWGKAAIAKWAEREIFGAKVTMEVVNAVDHYGDLIVTAKLDGNYDKTGLPDPLLMTFYFMLRSDKITKLIILLKKPAP